MNKLNELRGRYSAIANELTKLNNDHPGAAWGKDQQAVYDAKMGEIETIKNEIDRIVALEKAFMVDNLEAGVAEAADRLTRKDKSPIAAIHAKWLRGGDQAISREEWQAVRATMSTTTPSEGGYTVATEIATTVADALKGFGGVREVATVIQTAIGNPMSFPTSDGTSEMGEQLAENATASDLDIAFGSVPVDCYKYSSKVVTVPVELLQDSSVDIEAFVNTRCVQRVGRITNQRFTTGTGTGQPKGVVTAAALGKLGATGQTLTVTADDLIDLEHSVDYAYRALGRCAFMMNDASYKVVKKLKDTTGRPLYFPGDAGSQNQVSNGYLNGYPIVINNDVPVMAANAKSILFGDFSFYIVRDALQMSMMRFNDSAYAKNGQVGFLLFARSGGNYTDVGGGLKYYQNSAT